MNLNTHFRFGPVDNKLYEHSHKMSTKSSDNRVGTSFDSKVFFFWYTIRREKEQCGVLSGKNTHFETLQNTMGLASESVKNNYFTQLIMNYRIHYYKVVTCYKCATKTYGLNKVS